jgi:DNA-binding LacI/PurR family transcriptional regulator
MGEAMAGNSEKVKSQVDARNQPASGEPPSAKRRPLQNDRKVTLDDVGTLAGVSPSTVSRVVSHRVPVSPALREAVERAITQLGYVPNRAARSLATHRSDSVGVVISQVKSQWGMDPFIAQLLFGIAEELSETDIQLILILAANQRDEERVQRYAQQGHVDGVILVGSHNGDPVPEQLARRGAPLVLSGRPPMQIDVDYVDVDHRSGARNAVRHLVAGGRRQIATIYGTLDMPSSQDKLAGYRDALNEAGLPVDPTLEAAGNYNPAVASEAMRALLEQRPDIDAVFAASDTMAAGVVGVLGQAGRRIPDDVAVMGYDGTALAMSTRPMLSTVCQPTEAMGRAMAQLLLKRIEKPSAPPNPILFNTELIVRESSGAPAPGFIQRYNQSGLGDL